ncbi:MAG: hypothetical protein H6R15_4123 [Proteobacteria bacterium]|nr:hypothetical protein [Pseudomonadota bacterium]
MRRFLIILSFAFIPLPATAWNAAGHRLTASIAWQQLSPLSRQQIGEILARHPDYPGWLEKAGATEEAAIFAEAATWADTIRHDPRFYDEKREAPTPAIPGLPDQARHKSWHYVDLADDGAARVGELDRQIERLSRLLGTTDDRQQMAWALPWLVHLVGDIHQPLHVGQPGDEGGNRQEIENPFNKRRPFSSLHTYWDDLPGPSNLRGKRLEKTVSDLLERYPAPPQGTVGRWRDESHRLLAAAYPPASGSLLPSIDQEFDRQAHTVAQRRLVAAGYRLGRLLERIFRQRVSRETS